MNCTSCPHREILVADIIVIFVLLALIFGGLTLETQLLHSKADNQRFIGIIVAAALLNIGLYFMLYYLAPIVAGLVSGYFLINRKQALIAGFVSAFIAYLSLFLVLAPGIMEYYIDHSIPIPEMSVFYLILAFTALLISILGIIGAYIGSRITPRRTE